MNYSFYDRWGYTDNPFQPVPLRGDALGLQLLVGREVDLHTLEEAFLNPPRMPTVEGPTGVGKTSLLNVCVYRLLQERRRTGRGPLLLPCMRTFQPADLTSADQFRADLFLAVAQTLIQQRSVFEDGGRATPRLDDLNRWLNAPVITSVSAGFSTPVVGLSGGTQASINDAGGFLRSGLVVSLLRELKRLFGAGEGVVCVLDNMELLDFSAAGKKTLEALRDTVFSTHGIRLALAGSHGVVHRVLASPRLDGFFHEPLRVSGVAEKRAAEVLRSRRLAYAKDRVNRPFCPLLESDFSLLYRIQRSNLRSALSLADEYCAYVNAHPLKKPTEDAKAEAFAFWLRTKCENLYSAVRASQTQRSWEVFCTAARLDGSFSPSDFRLFDCKDSTHLRAFVKPLEDTGLVVSTVDEEDGRRRHLDFTAKGWLVYYALCLPDRSADSASVSTEGDG